MAYDLLSVYPAKLLEYCLAVTYLLLFIPFWRYVQGGRRAPVTMHAAVPARAAAAAKEAAAPAPALPRPVPQPAYAGWFRVPDSVHLHPGHTWARLEPDGFVAVGVDDFAHKLVGPGTVELPELGERVFQGESAIAIGDGAKAVRMLSPVDGTVVAVNARAREQGEGLDDPYGAGWLFKVKAPRLGANLHQLLTEGAARRFVEDASERLAARLSPELGRVLQDGGVPIHGIAQALAGEAWDDLARGFFLT
jgi:glycine cleavage system H protein